MRSFHFSHTSLSWTCSYLQFITADDRIIKFTGFVYFELHPFVRLNVDRTVRMLYRAEKTFITRDIPKNMLRWILRIYIAFTAKLIEVL